MPSRSSGTQLSRRQRRNGPTTACGNTVAVKLGRYVFSSPPFKSTRLQLTVYTEQYGENLYALAPITQTQPLDAKAGIKAW